MPAPSKAAGVVPRPRPQIAILASGEGTTAESFIRASAAKKIEPEVGLVICSKKHAGIFRRIEGLNQELKLNIPCRLINKFTHPAMNEPTAPGCQTDAEELAILELLQAGNYQLVVLMGYMKRIGQRLVHEFGWLPEHSSIYQTRMVNTHAGLLPDTKGLFGIHKEEHVLAQKLPYSGYTLHLVAENYDEGPVIAEHKVEVRPDDTPASLLARDQAVEKKYLPYDIEQFINKQQAYLKKEGV